MNWVGTSLRLLNKFVTRERKRTPRKTSWQNMLLQFRTGRIKCNIKKSLKASNEIVIKP